MSGAHCCVDGSALWSVSHESDRGTYHLSVLGNPPPELEKIGIALNAKQDQHDRSRRTGLPVDYTFDIPVELAAHLTGYRHDRWGSHLERQVFTTLEQTG